MHVCTYSSISVKSLDLPFSPGHPLEFEGRFVNLFGYYSPLCAGGAMVPPNFGRSVNPISTRGGGRLYLPNNTGTPGFSDLSTALPECCTKVYRMWTPKNTGRIRQKSTVFFKKLSLMKTCVTTVFIFASRVASKQSLSIQSTEFVQILRNTTNLCNLKLD